MSYDNSKEVGSGLEYIHTKFKKYIEEDKNNDPSHNYIYLLVHENIVIIGSWLICCMSIIVLSNINKTLLETYLVVAVILISLLTLAIALLVNICILISQSIKTDSVEIDSIDSLNKIDEDYKLSVEIRDNSCIESCIIFKENLSKIINRRQNRRIESKNMVPLITIAILLGFYYFTGYNIDNLNSKISPIIGGASLFAFVLSLLQFFLASEPKDTLLYNRFISILSVAIETNRLK